MKGLIRNTFYSMENNIIIAFLMSGFLIFVPFINKESTILCMIISVQIFIFIANVGTSLHADNVSKWNKFELTLPVSKTTIILSKYISFCMLILLGFIISILTGIILMFTTSTFNITSLLWGYEYGLTLSIIVASIMYPTMLIIGTEKNELIILLSACLAVTFMMLIALLLSPFTNGMNLYSPLVGTTLVCISPILLLISYFVSLQVYKNKEF